MASKDSPIVDITHTDSEINDDIARTVNSLNETLNCSVNWCNKTKPFVGLASFPRSGNTWVRHLLELATGIYTGSLYNAIGLYRAGFIGEYDDPELRRALVYKCHGFALTFDSGIILIRNPYDSLISFFTFKTKGIMAKQNADDFNNNKKWTDFFSSQYFKWLRIIDKWISSEKRILILHYEELTQHPMQGLEKILNFLNVTFTPERRRCVADDIEGKFHRRNKEAFQFDPYSKEMHVIMDADIEIANRLLKSINQTLVHKPSYLSMLSDAE
ncbi:sialate:O-sulfotransferase 1-like [Saccoglossus kowalevskii]|uniref:WSC domain-containing protein 1-like n=1 Tax=Saccoglossus kowalevskii TaxID=10224 RepID=A0ABM0MCK2_SACKO|nr:PREDICTED: WSC domain-containing protein 1-like [Saccoglossus kowalevskii]